MKRSTLLHLLSLFVGLIVTTMLRAQTKEFLTGKYDYTKDSSFIQVPLSYARDKVYLKKEVYQAFMKMRQAALQSGINLYIISGTRSFYDQCMKWEGKWRDPKFSGFSPGAERARQLLRWWSMPGTSRHHWGTDIDLNNMEPAYYQTAAGKKLYHWLVNNAPKFGFQQPFNAGRLSGYQEEKWHWSYVPLAKTYLKAYVNQITYADIRDFKGAHAAKELALITNWIQAVNPYCK